MRPDSIRKFSLFYLGSIAVSLVSAILGFGVVTASVEAQVAGIDPDLVRNLSIIGVALTVGIMVVLWHLTANKGYTIAKWIVILILLVNLYSAFSVLEGGLALYEIASLGSLLLQAVAVYFLFRPDAKAWFESPGETDAMPEDSGTTPVD